MVLVVDLSLSDREASDLIRIACTGQGFFYGGIFIYGPSNNCVCSGSPEDKLTHLYWSCFLITMLLKLQLQNMECQRV